MQVPLNKFNSGKSTYDFRGAETVQIRQNSDSDDKRFCTLQVITPILKTEWAIANTEAEYRRTFPQILPEKPIESHRKYRKNRFGFPSKKTGFPE